MFVGVIACTIKNKIDDRPIDPVWYFWNYCEVWNLEAGGFAYFRFYIYLTL